MSKTILLATLLLAVLSCRPAPPESPRLRAPLTLEAAFYPAPDGKMDHQWNVRNTSGQSIWCPWRTGTKVKGYSFTQYGYKLRSGKEWIQKRERPDHRQYEYHWNEIGHGDTFSIFREQHEDRSIPWDEVVVWLWCRIDGTEKELTIRWKKTD